MKRLATPVSHQLVVQSGRRGARGYIPEYEMRRPEDSSVAYRAVQDWKPMVHEVAHSAGKEEPETSTVMMHMLLIDSQGFRWPVRFRLQPGMTLFEVFAQTDQEWFGIFGPVEKGGYSYKRTYFGRASDSCRIGMTATSRCVTCMVMVPYEYLDAMSPPNKDEMLYLRSMQHKLYFDMTGNMRAACQVIVEDWMDGMTVVLPQKESFAFNMYYTTGVDKESVDSRTGLGHSGVNNDFKHNKGYLFPDEEGKKRKLTFREGVLNPDLADERGETSDVQFNMRGTNHAAATPLTDIFWLDNIDDLIRHKYPNWKGRYEFYNK
ncbi:hypothetical protein DIPPA_14085 [Diplonema papillatum]|nr:hypothetical protein DIPPA_14085 [Diplonema papillatum]